MAPEGYKDPLLLAQSWAKGSAWLKIPMDFPVTQLPAAAAVRKSRAVRALSSQHSELFGEAVFYFWVVAQQDRAPTAAAAPLPALRVPELLTGCEGQTPKTPWMLTGFSDHLLSLGDQIQTLGVFRFGWADGASVTFWNTPGNLS